MTTNNNKDIEEIISEFWFELGRYHSRQDQKKGSPRQELENWLRSALTSYADKRVREERDKDTALWNKHVDSLPDGVPEDWANQWAYTNNSTWINPNPPRQ